MIDAPSSSVNTLFQKWKDFLDHGELHTSTWIAGNDPILSQALQQRINEYFSWSAAEFEETITQAAQAATTQSNPAVLPDVPGYTMLSMLGRGGMGAVYRVRDALGREWAMKLVRPDRLSDTAKARFFSEAVAMAKLRHPNIISVHSYHEAAVPFLLMPLYSTSLFQKFPDYQQEPRQAVKLLAAIAEGVGCLHQHGYIHRDIKPSNVLLSDDEQPIVSDFGLVKDVGQAVGDTSRYDSPAPSTIDNLAPNHSTFTAAGSIMGTGRYMSPEQAAGQTQLANPTWDVWALGVMAHELLVGRAPPSSREPHTLLDPTTPDNPKPSTLNPNLPTGLEPILCKCLARHAADRYANAQQLANDLNAWLTATEPARSVAEPAPESQPPRRRMRWRVALAIAIAVLVGGVAVGVYYGQNAPTPEPETPRQRLERQLNAGKPVTIIGEQGRPDYFRLLALRAGAQPIEEQPVFTLTTYETIFVELLPANICPHGYELAGEFQFLNEHGPMSVAGFYFGHNPDIAADGPDHALATWAYHENALKSSKQPLQQRQRLGTCRLEMMHHVDPTIQQLGHGSVHGGLFTDFVNNQPKQNQPSEPHRLRLTVTPDTMTGYFDDQKIGERSLAELARRWNGAKAQQFPRPAFAPDGGAGLYISYSTVAIRRLEVIPRTKP